MTRDFCVLYQPITWEAEGDDGHGDTRYTIEQITDNNITYDTLCR